MDIENKTVARLALQADFQSNIRIYVFVSLIPISSIAKTQMKTWDVFKVSKA